MPTLNEVKEQKIVVQSVGEFTNALQQIATMRMMKLRTQVLRSRPFVETATQMLKELNTIRNTVDTQEIARLSKKKEDIPAAHNNKRAVLVITSNAGLIGSYNNEIYKKLEAVALREKEADYYIIGKKGQEYMSHDRIKVEHFPYDIPDNFTFEHLKRLINIFDYYTHLTLVYSRFVNTATREVVAVSVVEPTIAADDSLKEVPGKFTFEPNINELIQGVTKQLRSALFQQQLLDARLSQFSAQMIGMKAASDNANELLADLQLEYNKQRRKMIDKKIGEVFAGSALW